MATSEALLVVSRAWRKVISTWDVAVAAVLSTFNIRSRITLVT